MRQLDPRTAILGGKAQLETLCHLRALPGVPADRQAMRRLVGEDRRPYRLLSPRIALEHGTAGTRFHDAVGRCRSTADMVARQRPPPSKIRDEGVERPLWRDPHRDRLDDRRNGECDDAHLITVPEAVGSAPRSDGPDTGRDGLQSLDIRKS